MTASPMTALLIKQLASYINAESAPQDIPAPGVAQHLLERAELQAGRNPVEAAELRDAARAFLSVVR